MDRVRDNDQDFQSNHWPGKGKRKHNKFRYQQNTHGEGTSSGNARESRPKGLRGKQIGLWYAYRNRRAYANKSKDEMVQIIKEKTTKKPENARPLGTILLSASKRDNITKLLNEFVIFTAGDPNEIENAFRHEYKQHYNGNIIKSLENSVNKKLSSKNEILDELFLQEFRSKQSQPTYTEMFKFRQKLPSMNMKGQILQLLNENQVIVISGETGCGKTTQVAQFILDDYIENLKGSECKIVCTQPRRISAIAVAERVARERAENLGMSVGFQIRLEKSLPRDRGSILFCTTGVLLKHMETDPALSDVSHIIIDEIHERDIISDFLITVLKYVIVHRPDLKIILMSATINADAFSKYYNNAPHLNIPGFTYPVAEFFLEDVLQKTRFSFPKNKFAPRRQKNQSFHDDYIHPYIRQLESDKKYDSFVCNELKKLESEKLSIDLIFELIKCISKKGEVDGSILVFVPGFSDIQQLINMLQDSKEFPRSKNIIIPLHSQLPSVTQKEIFNPAPKGTRKIIVSTNIAETSITIDDVTVVIDCGFIKMTNLNADTGVETLGPEWVSRANAAQRRGRAGRVQPGVCYHLFTKVRYDLLDTFQKPEILRKRLENVILNLKMLQLGNAASFLSQLLDPPDPMNVSKSLNLLSRIGALDDSERLTPLGLHMAKLPLGAQCAKMLIMATLFGCLDPVLSVAASLDFKDGFQLSTDDTSKVDRARRELSRGTNSDHLLMHFAIKEFEQASDQHSFCRKYFLSLPIMRLLKDMRRQFAQLLFDMKFIADPSPTNSLCNQNSDNLSLVKAIICSGLYPNVGIISTKKGRIVNIRSVTNEKMAFHPKSIMNHVQAVTTPLIVYFQRLKSTKLFIHDATMICPFALVLFGDCFLRVSDEKFTGIFINGAMNFICSEATSDLIMRLRGKLDEILRYTVLHPGPIDWTNDTNQVRVLRTLVDVITREDRDDFDISDMEDC